jgi:hypothetical protein
MGHPAAARANAAPPPVGIRYSRTGSRVSVLALRRFEPRSLISLLNAAKEQPVASANTAELLTFGHGYRTETAKKLADPGCSPAVNYTGCKLQ